MVIYFIPRSELGTYNNHSLLYREYKVTHVVRPTKRLIVKGVFVLDDCESTLGTLYLQD